MNLNLQQENGKKNLFTQLIIQEKNQFTGQLIIKDSSGKKWTLYLCVGRLIWATGGNHVVRRLYRYLSEEFTKIQFQMMIPQERSCFQYGWDYEVINGLVLKKKLTKEQAQRLVSKIVTEVLFDILQDEVREVLTYESEPADLSESAMGMLALLSIKPILKDLLENWKAWKTESFGNCLLQSAPVLHNLQKLQQKISPRVYNHLVKVVNGKRTFREIASLLKQNEVQVARSLSFLIQKGFIQLVEIPDWPRPDLKTPDRTTHSLTSKRPKPLIACVDDSPQVCWEMQQIINPSHYEFIGIQDPVQALGILIDRKPDFIFLDLIMPVVNGYELCTQLRRVSALEKIPVVILTGGLIDRLRATMAGASDCIAKPINKKKVLAAIEKHLGDRPAPASVSKPVRSSSIEAAIL